MLVTGSTLQVRIGTDDPRSQQLIMLRQVGSDWEIVYMF
jgi:hypothetical protein